MEEKIKKEKSNKSIYIIYGIIIVVLIIIASILMLQLNNKKEKNEIEDQNNATVPNVVGMTFKEAEEELKKIGLEYVILPWKAPLNDDIVTTQDPKEGTVISKGEKVEISIKTQSTLKSDTSSNGYCFNIDIDTFIKKYNQIYENMNMSQQYVKSFLISRSNFNDISSIEHKNENKKRYACSITNFSGYDIITDLSDNILEASYGTTRTINSEGPAKRLLMILCNMSDSVAKDVVETCLSNIGTSLNYDEYNIIIRIIRENGNLYFDVWPNN